MKSKHLGCLRHELYLDINEIFNKDMLLNETMEDFRTKLRNRAVLSSLTQVSPIILNKTM